MVGQHHPRRVSTLPFFPCLVVPFSAANEPLTGPVDVHHGQADGRVRVAGKIYPRRLLPCAARDCQWSLYLGQRLGLDCPVNRVAGRFQSQDEAVRRVQLSIPLVEVDRFYWSYGFWLLVLWIGILLEDMFRIYVWIVFRWMFW